MNFITLRLKFPNANNKSENKIKLNNENLCWVPFLKKADLIAIIKSSLPLSITFSIQITW